MTLQWAAGFASAGCSLYSIRPCVRDILAGRAHPSPVGWLIFAWLCAVFTAALALAGGGPQLALPAAETAGCTLIAVLAWRTARKRRGQALAAEHLPRWLTLTILGGVGAALAIVAASAAGVPLASPVQAAVLLIGVDLTGGVVTVTDVAHEPDTESPATWYWYGLGEIFATVAAIGSAWIFWASSLSGLAVAAAIIITGRRGSVVHPPEPILERTP